MMIHLPKDLESVIEAEVHNGRFASMDEAMARASELLILEIRQNRLAFPSDKTGSQPDPHLGSIGAMKEDAALLDEIVAEAYRRRREDTGREFDFE